MKHILHFSIVLFITLLISSCAKKTIPFDKLQIRNDIAYEVNSSTPFTGTVIKYFDKEKKTIESEIEYRNGKLNGKMATFYENQQKQDENYYADGAPLKLQKWYSNGQQKSLLTYKDKKLDEYKFFEMKGQLVINLKVDPLIQYTRFELFTEEGRLSNNIYYLNTDIVPLDSIVHCINFTPEMVERRFGKPKIEEKRGMLLSYSYGFVQNITPDKCPEKANLQFAWWNDKMGSPSEFAWILLTYYNHNEDELSVIESKMKLCVEKLGLTSKDANNSFFENEEFSVGLIKMDNNITYSLGGNKHSKWECLKY